MYVCTVHVCIWSLIQGGGYCVLGCYCGGVTSPSSTAIVWIVTVVNFVISFSETSHTRHTGVHNSIEGTTHKHTHIPSKKSIDDEMRWWKKNQRVKPGKGHRAPLPYRPPSSSSSSSHIPHPTLASFFLSYTFTLVARPCCWRSNLVFSMSRMNGSRVGVTHIKKNHTLASPVFLLRSYDNSPSFSFLFTVSCIVCFWRCSSRHCLFIRLAWLGMCASY